MKRILGLLVFGILLVSVVGTAAADPADMIRFGVSGVQTCQMGR